MSVHATAWAWEQPVGGTQKLVLLSLADHAGENDECYPSMQRLAERCCVKLRAARAAVRALEEAGYLKRYVRPRENGATSSNRYVLAVGGSAQPPGTVVPEPPAPADRSPRHEDAGASEPSVEPSVEQDEVDALWAAVQQRTPTPVATLTPSRRRELRKALNAAPFDLCVRALDGLVEYKRQGKGRKPNARPEWTTALQTRPGSQPLPDQIAWWAEQAPGGASMDGTFNHVLPEIHPNASTRLIREHDHATEINTIAASEIHEALAKRGLKAVFEGRALKIVRTEA